MAAQLVRRTCSRDRVAAALLGVSAALGCRDTTSPSGQRGPSEVEPRSGRYVVAEFVFRNICAEPEFGLSNRAATTHSATFDLTPDATDLGTVTLSGVLRVTSPVTGIPEVVIFEGPDTGRYRISGDTLRLAFPKEINEWVGVLRFTQYRGGQLAGASRTSCRSLSLRLERRP